jgi:cellulose biosynthesis protein BcsQ
VAATTQAPLLKGAPPPQEQQPQEQQPQEQPKLSRSSLHLLLLREKPELAALEQQRRPIVLRCESVVSKGQEKEGKQSIGQHRWRRKKREKKGFASLLASRIRARFVPLLSSSLPPSVAIRYSETFFEPAAHSEPKNMGVQEARRLAWRLAKSASQQWRRLRKRKC